MNPPDIRAALDTSVVMRLLTGQPHDLATTARVFMAETEVSGTKVFVSNLVVMEAYFACQHHYSMPKAEVLTGMLTLFSLPIFVLHPQLLTLLSRPDLATSKPGFLDQLIHAEATNANLPLVSFEKATARLTQTIILRGKKDEL
jgi:predicted nucleic-acid-binding protein